MSENCPEHVSYEDQSAYDVADMVKQFFRDLPEPLFTNKLREAFLHIYQCECQRRPPRARTPSPGARARLRGRLGGRAAPFPEVTSFAVGWESPGRMPCL